MAICHCDFYHPIQSYQSVVAPAALLSIPKCIKGRPNQSHLHNCNMPHSMTQNTVAKLAWLVKRIEETAEKPDWHAQDWIVLRTDCESLSVATSSSSDPVVSKCIVILADILVRIRVVLDSGAEAVQRIWSVDDLVVLNQRLHEIQRENSGPRYANLGVNSRLPTNDCLVPFLILSRRRKSQRRRRKSRAPTTTPGQNDSRCLPSSCWTDSRSPL
jgi:hypothetical protein